MALSPSAKLERRRVSVSILPGLQATLRCFAQELIQEHGESAFQDPKMKTCMTAVLRRLLPPWPRRSGRPGLVSVTAAIRLHDELKRSCPGQADKEIWQRIYKALIPRWSAMTAIERRSEADQLHQRVRWRVYAQRRKHRKTHAGKPTA